MAIDILSAVSDRTRRSMLSLIKKNGKLCACELPGKVRKTQPAVSQHLKVLRAAKLVQMQKDGAKRIYSLTQKGAQVLSDISGW